MTIGSRRWASLAWVVSAAVGLLVLVVLSGCGGRSDLKYPHLPPEHPLNYKPIW